MSQSFGVLSPTRGLTPNAEGRWLCLHPGLLGGAEPEGSPGATLPLALLCPVASLVRPVPVAPQNGGACVPSAPCHPRRSGAEPPRWRRRGQFGHGDRGPTGTGGTPAASPTWGSTQRPILCRDPCLGQSHLSIGDPTDATGGDPRADSEDPLADQSLQESTRWPIPHEDLSIPVDPWGRSGSPGGDESPGIPPPRWLEQGAVTPLLSGVPIPGQVAPWGRASLRPRVAAPTGGSTHGWWPGRESGHGTGAGAAARQALAWRGGRCRNVAFLGAGAQHGPTRGRPRAEPGARRRRQSRAGPALGHAEVPLPCCRPQRALLHPKNVQGHGFSSFSQSGRCNPWADCSKPFGARSCPYLG